MENRGEQGTYLCKQQGFPFAVCLFFEVAVLENSESCRFFFLYDWFIFITLYAWCAKLIMLRKWMRLDISVLEDEV